MKKNILLCIFGIFLLNNFFLNCKSKSVDINDYCNWRLISELDTISYITDTLYLFKEYCSSDSNLIGFCTETNSNQVASILHPGFVHIDPKKSIKQNYETAFFAFATGNSIMSYKRFSQQNISLNRRDRDSIYFLDSHNFNSHKINSDSFIQFCDKKFERINKRLVKNNPSLIPPSKGCLRMQGGNFQITYMPSSKYCKLHFRNPDNHLKLEVVWTKINFIVDLKEL